MFLTGANGFIGLNIARSLIESGYRVKAWVRPLSDIKFLNSMNVEICRGDLKNKDALVEAMMDCDYVIHTAGNTSCDKKDLPALTEVNVMGTKAIVESAIDAGIKRLVYTSTTSTLGSKKEKNNGADESESLKGFRADSPYGQTKQIAENIVLDANKNGLETIILNLAEVVGAFDHNLQWGRMVLAINQDRLPFVPPGGGSFCSATDAAMAHVNALTMGRCGEKYIISGADHSFKEFLEEINQQVQKPCEFPDVNYFNLWFRARLYEFLPWIFKTKPLVEAYRIRVFGGHHYFDSTKAKKELAYQTSSLKKMVRECVEWYSLNGFIKQV